MEEEDRGLKDQMRRIEVRRRRIEVWRVEEVRRMRRRRRVEVGGGGSRFKDAR